MGFQHDSCGYRGRVSLFPEICCGVDKRGVGNEAIIAAKHPVIKGYSIGHAVKHMYNDHMVLLPGLSEILLKDKEGDPIVICGKHGKGKVIFDGTIVYEVSNVEAKCAVGINKDLLINSINWFCE